MKSSIIPLTRKTNGNLSSRQRLVHRGFGLLELLVAFSITTFLLFATAHLVLHSLRIQRTSNHSTASAELACSKLEYFKSLPFEAVGLAAGSQTELRQGKNNKATFVLEWTIEDIAPDLKRIKIACFSKNIPEKETRLVLHVCKGLGF